MKCNKKSQFPFTGGQSCMFKGNEGEWWHLNHPLHKLEPGLNSVKQPCDFRVIWGHSLDFEISLKLFKHTPQSFYTSVVNRSTLCSRGIDPRSHWQGHKLFRSMFHMHFGDPHQAHAAENQQFCTSALLSEKSRGSWPLFPAPLWSVIIYLSVLLGLLWLYYNGDCSLPDPSGDLSGVV